MGNDSELALYRSDLSAIENTRKDLATSRSASKSPTEKECLTFGSSLDVSSADRLESLYGFSGSFSTLQLDLQAFVRLLRRSRESFGLRLLWTARTNRVRQRG